MNATPLGEVTHFYLQSKAFNGMSLSALSLALGIKPDQIASVVEPLIADGRLNLNFGDRHPNPHIQAFPPEPAPTQIKKLSLAAAFAHVCAYPSQDHLATVVHNSQYPGEPFTFRLALGEPQLSFVTFELSILETYRNDPRYSYSCDDIWGHIGTYENSELPARDYAFLQHFGFAYDSDFNRGVAVFLRYLADLSPEHQQIWNTKVLSGRYTLHPDYFDTAILGKWAEGISIFQAFGEELHLINEMCGLMGKPPLFQNDFNDANRPQQFAFLLRPTQKEFDDFILLLDKMMSDNLNHAFFAGDVSAQKETPRKDGKIVVEQKGTIQLLDEYLHTHWTVVDEPLSSAILAAFRTVRNLRQAPAHKLDDNYFDLAIYKRHRDLVIDVYSAVRNIRLLFSNHPLVGQIEIPEPLITGDRIRTF